MEVDYGFVAAVERHCTGANAHDARGTLQMYLNHCYLDCQEKAQANKHTLYELMREARRKAVGAV